MHAISFIQDLAVIMLVAGIVTVLFHRLKQPVVLGYIVAGFIIGPHTPPVGLIHDEGTIKILAELGVIFLMFCLGLEFSLRKLFKVGATAFIAAFLEIVLMIWIGYEIGRFFDWSAMDSLFLGAILAISSTTIIVKALNDLKLKNQRFAQLIFGVLIVEDILGIGIIALLSGIAVSGSVNSGEVFSTVGELSLFMIVALVIGILLVSRLLAYVARFDSNEMLLVTVLGLCFGFCLLVAKLEYSMVLGAFLMGAIMAESVHVQKIERLIEPVRDLFSAIFFVAIGLMIDPRVLLDYAWPIAVITLALAMAIFLCGGYFAEHIGVYLSDWISDDRRHKALIWGAALLLSLPFLIAAYRKLKALSMLLAEMGVKPGAAGRHTERVRRVIAEVIPLLSLLVIFLLLAALSSSILPPSELLLVIGGIAAGVAALLWRWFIRVHSRMQIALLETLGNHKEPPGH